MTTLIMPSSPGFINVRWGQSANTQVFQSPLTKSVQTFGLTGARWVAVFTLPPMKLINAANWFAFLSQLEGQNGRFFANPPNKIPQGLATGTPLVKGASQTGNSLITDGWTASINSILKKGDFIEVNSELKMIISDANSDGSGDSTLSITPALRNSPSDDDAITVSNPTTIMMLSSNEQANWTKDKLNLYGITFAGVEVWT